MDQLIKLKNGVMPSLLIAFVASLNGCAGVTFYSEPELKNETGIPVYAPKPYLLVSRTDAKDKPVDISIVYLNNPEKVIYAKPRSGFGSSNLTLALENGQMTSFGQQTDSKIPELITALGGLVTSRATATKTEAEAAQIRAGIGTQQAAVSPVEASKKIDAIADDMLKKIQANSLSGLTGDETQTIKSAAQALKAAAAALADPANVPSASQYFDQVKAQTDLLGKIATPTVSAPRDSSLQIIQAWAAELSKIIDSTQPEKIAPPTFELYEIIQSDGVSKLHRVYP